jgi:hypothetical protein
MSKIEDILYEAHYLGLRDEVINEVSNVRNEEKNKYTPLSDLYEKALKKTKIKKKRDSVTTIIG